ncbi:MAG: phosphate acyltransferase, partial [Pseudomonadota bacterium]
PRLIVEIAPAVAKAAMESGIARKPIKDLQSYKNKLGHYVYRSGAAMRPLFERAKSNPCRVVYAEGEEEKVLRAVQVVINEGLAKPILIGRRDVVLQRIHRFGLRMEIDKDFELCDPQSDTRYRAYWELYHSICGRKGISVEYAKTVVRTRNTVIACLMVTRGEADAMLCGLVGQYRDHVNDVHDIIGCANGINGLYTMNMLLLDKGTIFIADTHVVHQPDAHQLVEMTCLAAKKAKGFGIDIKIALLSHSNFGSDKNPHSRIVREAVRILHQNHPDLVVEGEMQADTALDQSLRSQFLTENHLSGSANLLIMPNLDSASIAYNTLKVLANGLPVGPILLGAKLPLHIMTTAATSRSIVNLTAIVVDDANLFARGKKTKNKKALTKG